MKSGFQDVPESDFQKYENQTSGSMKTKLQEVPKSDCNKTDINKTDYSETDPIQSNLSFSAGEVCPINSDMMERMETYREILRVNVDYEGFVEKGEGEDVGELIELMVEILMLPDDTVVRIGGADKPVSVVKSRFLKLTYSHIEYVLFSLHRNTSKVTNIRAYLLTTLYNSSMTMNHYYQAEVNHLSITEGWGFYVAYRWPVFSFKWLKFVRDGCAMNLRFIRDLRTIYRRFSAPVYPGAHNVRPRHAPFCRRQANACQALHR